MVSDQVLYCLQTEVSFKICIKMKNTSQQHLSCKWNRQIDSDRENAFGINGLKRSYLNEQQQQQKQQQQQIQEQQQPTLERTAVSIKAI